MASGLYVSKVINDSPAFEAGIERGDIITEINGSPVVDFASFQTALRQAGAEGKALVKVIRTTMTTDNEMTFDVSLGTRK